jgi:hypothetical protein
MNKHEFAATVRIGHEQLLAALDSLSDDELALPAQGEWTRRDVVAHIEWWERHSPPTSSPPFAMGATRTRQTSPST